MDISKTFESQKNRKALIYTLIICGGLLLLFILISWKVMPPPEPVVQDLIEINLGNNEEGFGEEQPLIKGDRAQAQEATNIPKPTPQQEEKENVTPDDNAEENAAPVPKLEKIIPKIKPTNTPVNAKPVVVPVPKPAKPKITMPDGTGKTGGNNDNEDNYKIGQGNNKNGKGDAGDPKGNKDSYGNTPGGKVGGPKVISGSRKIIRNYSFTGELNKATIYASVRVSAGGQGSLLRLVKPSTSFEQRYATAISNYLSKMQFNKGPDESDVTVQFNFTVH